MRGTKRSYHSTITGSIINSSSSSSSSSCDLQDVWKKACWKAMGYDNDDDSWEFIDTVAAGEETTRDEASSTFEVINLLPPSMFIDDEDAEYNNTTSDSSPSSRDPWMNMAQQIQSNINDMRNWLQQKQFTYIQLTTSDPEASLIQSTVTSFTATTANEIESLHQLLRSTGSNSNSGGNATGAAKANEVKQNQRQQHCAGIVQILMMELQDTIAQPLQQLTKLRKRMAVQIYQNPISCRIYTPKSRPSRNQRKDSRQNTKRHDTTLELLGLDDDDDDEDDFSETDQLAATQMTDQRFIPTRPSHKLHQNFWSLYDDGNNNISTMMQRPISIFESSTSHPSSDNTITSSSATFTVRKVDSVTQQNTLNDKPKPSSTIVPKYPDRNIDNNDIDAALHQESLQLQMKVQQNKDLDSVQQMEQTMIDITTLLSQFTNLVVEQQENIVDIYDTTTTTQENIQKGTDNLFQAKERVRSSKHYMATTISGMAMLLLLFHWLRP